MFCCLATHLRQSFETRMRAVRRYDILLGGDYNCFPDERLADWFPVPEHRPETVMRCVLNRERIKLPRGRSCMLLAWQ